MPTPLILPRYFTEKLRAARYYVLQTQDDVAQNIGYWGKQSWWRIEDGRKGMSLKRLADVAALYQFRTHYLICDDIPVSDLLKYSYAGISPTTDVNLLGAKLREMRILHDWTQAWVADEVEIAQTSYNRIERGERKPSIFRLQRLCDTFGVMSDYFLYDSISEYRHYTIAASMV